MFFKLNKTNACFMSLMIIALVSCAYCVTLIMAASGNGVTSELALQFIKLALAAGSFCVISAAWVICSKD